MKKITAEISNEWMFILDIITRHQEGFIWIDVEDLTEQV